MLKTNIGAKNAVFDLVSTRSPHVRVVKNAWCLSSLINGTTEEWDCAMFFYTILYSDCLRHGVIEQVRSAVDDLRMLRNEIAHWPQAYISYPAFSSICIRAEAAFKSLNRDYSTPNYQRKSTFFERKYEGTCISSIFQS